MCCLATTKSGDMQMFTFYSFILHKQLPFVSLGRLWRSIFFRKRKNKMPCQSSTQTHIHVYDMPAHSGVRRTQLYRWLAHCSAIFIGNVIHTQSVCEYCKIVVGSWPLSVSIWSEMCGNQIETNVFSSFLSFQLFACECVWVSLQRPILLCSFIHFLLLSNVLKMLRRQVQKGHQPKEFGIFVVCLYCHHQQQTQSEDDVNGRG